MEYSGNSHPEVGLGVPTDRIDGARVDRAAVDERSRGIAVIAHELRNSLEVILNAARLLRSPSSGSVDSARSLIARHVGLMTRHIEDLLEPQSRGALSDDSRHRSRVDLRTVAGCAVGSIRPELARRGHRLVVQLPEEPVWVYADGARLEQAFSNLLINAAKYTPDGGDISLLMETSAESVSLRIRDSGLGIEAAMLSRVFGMFVQVATALPGRENGRGIGLAVVRSVVE